MLSNWKDLWQIHLVLNFLVEIFVYNVMITWDYLCIYKISSSICFKKKKYCALPVRSSGRWAQGICMGTLIIVHVLQYWFCKLLRFKYSVMLRFILKQNSFFFLFLLNIFYSRLLNLGNLSRNTLTDIL